MELNGKVRITTEHNEHKKKVAEHALNTQTYTTKNTKALFLYVFASKQLFLFWCLKRFLQKSSVVQCRLLVVTSCTIFCIR